MYHTHTQVLLMKMRNKRREIPKHGLYLSRAVWMVVAACCCFSIFLNKNGKKLQLFFILARAKLVSYAHIRIEYEMKVNQIFTDFSIKHLFDFWKTVRTVFLSLFFLSILFFFCLPLKKGLLIFNIIIIIIGQFGALVCNH